MLSNRLLSKIHSEFNSGFGVFAFRPGGDNANKAVAKLRAFCYDMAYRKLRLYLSQKERKMEHESG